MQLRDGDTVTIRGVAKFKWLGRGTISFDEPSGVTVIKVGPDITPPTGNAAIYRPGFIDFIKGAASFLLPPDPYADAPRDEKGNIIKFRIWGPNAKIFIKGTTFKLTHDEATKKMTVSVVEGVVEVEPNFEGQRPFELTAGQRAEISPSGVAAPGAQGSADGPAVRPVKAVFGPNERIDVEYSNPKASGWDWVVIVQPSKLILASGPHSSVGPAYAIQFDPNNNSLRDVRSTNSFPPLPEGQYEVRYISWDGGNNLPKVSAPFTVGISAPPPQPPVVTPPPNITPSPAKDLTGLWRNPGNNEVYRLRQIGMRLYWGVDAVSARSFANIYYGDIVGNTVDGIWIDLPGSPYVGDGKIFLRIESECRLVKTAQVNHYAAETWVKKDSPCDQQVAGTPPATLAGWLSGLWRNPGGEAVYRFRQVGNKLHWGVDAVPIKSFANTFEGEISGSTIEGSWLDLPGSPSLGGGRLSLKIESACRIVKTAEVNQYGAQVWVRKDSLCDVTGLQQKTAQNPATTKPRVEEIPDAASVNQPTGRASNTGNNQTPKPRVEEIPDGKTVSKVTGNPQKPKPKVEEIPDDEITVAKNDDNVFINETPKMEERTAPARQQPQPKPQKTPAPKKEGPGFWEKLGTAINTAVTQQQQQPPPAGGTTQQPQRQPDGSCRGGSYWLGTPTTAKTSGFQIPWSSPIGADRHHFRVYRAGTTSLSATTISRKTLTLAALAGTFICPRANMTYTCFPALWPTPGM
jgi:hypothetical protein